MFGKVKKWLGIEGVKVELLLPEEVRERDGVIPGKLRFQSLNDQKITTVKVILIEKYARGRGKEKLVDEYELNEITLNQEIDVPAQEIVEVDFELPFQLVHSDMDEMERSIFTSGFAKIAKMVNAVKSTYRVEAEAKVKGVALSPFDRKEVKIK